MLYQLSYAHHINFKMVRLRGLEPLTYGLEVRCSIQLSYRRRFPEATGREDLNLRPPAPKAGALPGCATPRLGVHSLMPKNIRPKAKGEYRFCGRPVSMAGSADRASFEFLVLSFEFQPTGRRTIKGRPNSKLKTKNSKLTECFLLRHRESERIQPRTDDLTLFGDHLLRALPTDFEESVQLVA